MGLDFNWAQIISNDIPHQLENYQQTNKFFMTSYLVYTIIYICIFEELLVRRDIDTLEEPMQFWYRMLWKHKAPFYIYHIQDSFLGCCREILTRTVLDRFTQEARDFLEGKGILYLKEEHSFIRLFSYEHSPIILPKFVTDRLLILEVCR